jgi:aspartate/methionine/tyrosine aminotransferase
MFSRRAQWNTPPNRLAIARARHPNALDLTESNPTRAGIPYPLDELGEAFARAAHAKYDPDPRGLPSAREALATHLGCDPGELLISASTSEAYSFLFKLLTDPGDNVVTATPSYPLLEHLAQLELIEQRTFAMEFHRRWEIDASHIPLDDRTRAIVVVNPNNPTGSYVSRDEQEALSRLGVPIISDEVFLDYPLEASGASFENGFVLGGLSKSCGLPHLKLGWIQTKDREALDALELIADNFLSVSTPVQVALPELLVLGGRIRDAIRQRTRESLEVLKRALAERRHAQLLPVEGGWSAVVRIPQLESDEEFALRALEEHDVIVHPGYFFDFARDGYFVVSLLTPPAILEEGISRIV